MLRVKYERYLNDFHHKSETKSFADLIELESWMFGQMQQNYSGDKGAMSFPTPRKAKRIGENGPWRIELRPVYGGSRFGFIKSRLPKITARITSCRTSTSRCEEGQEK